MIKIGLIGILIALLNFIDTGIERRVTFYWPSECGWNDAVADYPLKIDFDKLESGELRWCAVSRELRSTYPYGSIIYVDGEGFFAVHDCTAAWVKNTVDILVPSERMERNYRRVWVVWRAP